MKWINKYFSRTEFLLADCVKSKLHHMIKFSTLIKIMNQVKVFSRKTNGCTNLSLIKLRTDQTQSLNFLLKGKWHDSVNIKACGWNFRSHLSAIFWCMSKSLYIIYIQVWRKAHWMLDLVWSMVHLRWIFLKNVLLSLPSRVLLP